jgi:hypothetical protein
VARRQSPFAPSAQPTATQPRSMMNTATAAKPARQIDP